MLFMILTLLNGVIAADVYARQTAAPTVAFESLGGCHFHETLQYCLDGGSEFRIIPEATMTGTDAAPKSYIRCHNHGTDTYCLVPSGGGEVQVINAEATITGNTNSEESGKKDANVTAVSDCHVSSSSLYCSAESTVYYAQTSVTATEDIPAQFTGCHNHGDDLILFNRNRHCIGSVEGNIVMVFLKQFGTGVIISTTFAHLINHAALMFGNSCLQGMEYEATTAAIVMAGLFLAFLIEFIFSRILRGQMAKQAEVSYATISQTTLAKVESTNVTIMEAGIIFHSLLIGVTTVVAGDSYYVTLAVVILFHQLFEGIALGSRIAALGYGAAFSKSSTVDAMQPHVHQTLGAEAEIDLSQPSTVSLMKKLITATAFSFVTPVGMAIGIGVLSSFNGNDPSTIVAIGTLDALSAGILVWVGVAEMMAYDWMLDDDMANASWFTTSVAMFGLIAGMALMSFLGKWA